MEYLIQRNVATKKQRDWHQSLPALCVGMCVGAVLLWFAGVIIVNLIPIYNRKTGSDTLPNDQAESSLIINVYSTSINLNHHKTTDVTNNDDIAEQLETIFGLTSGSLRVSSILIDRNDATRPRRQYQWTSECMDLSPNQTLVNIAAAIVYPKYCKRSKKCKDKFTAITQRKLSGHTISFPISITFADGQSTRAQLTLCNSAAKNREPVTGVGAPSVTFNCGPSHNCEIHQTLIIDTIYPYPQSNKPIISANYSYPGPLIEACENDTLVIRVINRLSVPTTVHWHGIYQFGTPDMDGAVGVTQCAIPPRNEVTYKFRAQPSGTTWYHGHYSEQYTDGLFGPLIIHPLNDPNQNQYDSEQILMVSDWYNQPAHSVLLPWYLNSNNADGNEPSPDAIVVNGKFTQSLFIAVGNSTRIRFRIINAAAFSMYSFSIDGFPLHIIEIDGTNTLPYTVNSFMINVAQRVSFYIHLDELDPTYTSLTASLTNSLFIRFQAVLSMYPVDIDDYISPFGDQRYPYPTFFQPLYLAILSLDSTNAQPTYPANQPTPTPQNAPSPTETNLLDARPVSQIGNGIPQPTHSLNLVIVFDTAANGINYAYFNGVSYMSDANGMSMGPAPTQGITSDLYTPLLYQMATKPNGLGIPSPLQQSGSQLPVIQSDGNGHYLVPYQAVVDVFINNTDAGEHPLHLHGSNFWIIATSDYPEAEFLYQGNYLRRDVVSVPASGWAKIRFVAFNPGAWFFHCHIEWHMAAGLALVFIISPQQLLANGYTTSQQQTNICAALKQYNKKMG